MAGDTASPWDAPDPTKLRASATPAPARERSAATLTEPLPAALPPEPPHRRHRSLIGRSHPPGAAPATESAAPAGPVEPADVEPADVAAPTTSGEIPPLPAAGPVLVEAVPVEAVPVDAVPVEAVPVEAVPVEAVRAVSGFETLVPADAPLTRELDPDDDPLFSEWTVDDEAPPVARRPAWLPWAAALAMVVGTGGVLLLAGVAWWLAGGLGASVDAPSAPPEPPAEVDEPPADSPPPEEPPEEAPADEPPPREAPRPTPRPAAPPPPPAAAEPEAPRPKRGKAKSPPKARVKPKEAAPPSDDEGSPWGEQPSEEAPEGVWGATD